MIDNASRPHAQSAAGEKELGFVKTAKFDDSIAINVVLEPIKQSDGTISLGELARALPKLDTQLLIGSLLEAKNTGYVSVLPAGDGEFEVTLTDAGSKLLESH